MLLAIGTLWPRTTPCTVSMMFKPIELNAAPILR